MSAAAIVPVTPDGAPVPAVNRADRRDSMVASVTPPERFGTLALAANPISRATLALTTRKRDAIFTNRRVIAHWLLHDKFISMGKLGRCQNFGICRIRTAITDIVGDGAFKQIWLLRNISDLMTQRCLGNLGNILIINEDFTAVDVIKALGEGNQC